MHTENAYAIFRKEELLTLTPSLQRTVDALPAWIPVPARVAAIDQRHVNAAIVMMGALCASAVVNGMRTCGRGEALPGLPMGIRAARLRAPRRGGS